MPAQRIKVCVTGAAGRVGRAVVAGVVNDPATELVAAVDITETHERGIRLTGMEIFTPRRPTCSRRWSTCTAHRQFLRNAVE